MNSTASKFLPTNTSSWRLGFHRLSQTDHSFVKELLVNGVVVVVSVEKRELIFKTRSIQFHLPVVDTLFSDNRECLCKEMCLTCRS